LTYPIYYTIILKLKYVYTKLGVCCEGFTLVTSQTEYFLGDSMVDGKVSWVRQSLQLPG
jgi:hypothetical protein